FNAIFGTISAPRGEAISAQGSHTPSSPTFWRTHAEGCETQGRAAMVAWENTRKGTAFCSQNANNPGSFDFRSTVATSLTSVMLLPSSAASTAAPICPADTPLRQPIPTTSGLTASVAVVITGTAPIAAATR